MKPSEPVDFDDSELPVCISAPKFNMVVAVLFIALPAIGCIGFAVFIFFGNDPHNILSSLFMGGIGFGLLLGFASAISSQIELTPTSIVHTNIFRRKSLRLHDIVSVNRRNTWNGFFLTIKTNNDILFLGYLTFTNIQIVKIEKFILNRVPEVIYAITNPA
jgi:hypothetical protein